MSNEVLGLIALVALTTVIFSGFPIAFILLFVGIVFGYLGIGDLVFNLLTLQFFSTMRDITLAAVPLFVFMGFVLEKSNLVERMFRLFMIIMGRLRGSLYLAVCITAIVLAASTGIVGASVTLLGVMAGPLMKRYKYDVKLSAGTITAGGTLGILIPPSVMLVVMGPVMGVSVTQLFAAAIIPGVIMATLYALYSLIRCYLNPELGPPIPEEERKISKEELLRELFLGVLPPVLVILATLGSILLGLATPTDAAALGATCTLILAILSKQFGMKELKESMLLTVKVSTMIMFLLACSNFFGAVFSRLGTAEMISNALLGLSLPSALMLMLILAIVFLLGWPLEWVPIVVIYIPIMLPVVQQYGWNILWFCALVAVCMQTAWLSPPVALSAYFLKGVVPEWELKDIYLGMMQFMVLQLIALTLVGLFPQLALWLPSLVK